MFYIHFLYLYSYLSCFGLIKDIFFQEHNTIKVSLEDTVTQYRQLYKQNMLNLSWYLLPFFIFLELVYYASPEYNYFASIIQVPICFYSGYILHGVIKNVMVNNFGHKLDNNNNKIRNVIIFMALNRSAKEIYLLYIVPGLLIPFMFGMNKFTIDIIFHLFIGYVGMYYSNNYYIDYSLSELDKFFNLYIIDRYINGSVCYIMKLLTKYVGFKNSVVEDKENLVLEAEENLEAELEENLEAELEENLEAELEENLEAELEENLEAELEAEDILVIEEEEDVGLKSHYKSKNI
jgi:hypothetical protein